MTSKLQFQQDQSVRDFASAVVLGMIPSVESEVKFGHVPDAVAATLNDAWELGATITPYLWPDQAGETVEILSASPTDTQSFTIEGLNADIVDGVKGKPLTETVTLTGTTPAPVPGNWLSIHRIYSNADEGDETTGAVALRGDGVKSTNIFASAQIDDQQSSQAIYMVPGDKVAVISNYSTAINTGGNQDASAEMKLVVSKFGKVFRTFIRYGLQKRGTSNLSSDLVVPPVIDSLSRIKVQGLPDSGPMDMSGEFSMLLVDRSVVPKNVLDAIA
jgi:hypothetical protein